MNDMRTPASEDYLKVIYDLTATHGRATTNQIAERLEVKAASVTGMIRKLSEADPPLVEYRKHRGVVLTPQGENIALEIIRRHRLLELFLQQTLGYTWDEVHGEAERLEHAISADFADRIAQAMGDPRHDPHGEPIPSHDLRLPPSSEVRLSELRPGQNAIVEWVDAADLSLLRYLSEIGLVPQARVAVLDHSIFDDNLRLHVAGQEEPVVLGPAVTRQVYVAETSNS